jgi:hypothetical protein
MHGNIYFVIIVNYVVTILLFNIVGEDVIMEPVELMISKVEMKQQKCAKDIQHNRCGHLKASFKTLKI